MSDKREIRGLQKDLIAFLRSDLYESVPMLPDANPDTDGEWEAPTGWRVRLTRPDLAGGPLRIDVAIYSPDRQGVTALPDVRSIEVLDAVLP